MAAGSSSPPGPSQRRKLAAQGKAMPAGQYPIRSRGDLAKAIRAVGRGNGSHPAIRQHIIKRAKNMGATGMLPSHWKTDGTVNLAFNPSEARITSGTGGGQWTAGSTQGGPPKGVPNNPTRIAALQRQLGLPDTGVWNAATRAALAAYAAAHGISVNAVAGALGKADVTKFGSATKGKKGGKGKKSGGKGRHSGTGRHRAAGTGRHRSSTGRHRGSGTGRHRSSTGRHRSSSGRHRSSTGRHRAGRAAQGNSPQSTALARQVAHALARLGAQPRASKAPKSRAPRTPRASTPRAPRSHTPRVAHSTRGPSNLRQQVHASLRASKRPDFQRQAAVGKIPTRHH